MAGPHGLAVQDGRLIGCDAGMDPGRPSYDSPSSGYAFEINIA